jgi:hypothetical protein
MVNPATADFHILTWRWKFCRGPGGRTVCFAACNMPPACPWCDERPSTLDNQVLSSEISLALYLLPALFAGIGINIISYVIVSHLGDAQREFARQQARAGAIDAGKPLAP